jgi:hypothetical protein
MPEAVAPKKLRGSKLVAKKTRDELEEDSRLIWDSALGILSVVLLAIVLYLIFSW